MTVLEIVNKIMRRLRENQVSSLTETEYSSLVADFVADIHEDLLEQEWSSFEHTIVVPVDALQRSLDLSRLESSGGDISSGRVPTQESIPLWVQQYDTISTTVGTAVNFLLPQEAEYQYYQDTGQTADYIDSAAIRANPNRDGLEALLYPVPRAARVLRFRLWTPEAMVDIDEDDDRELLVPWRPLYLGGLYLALNERGEELGEPGGVAEQRYERSVRKAFEADSNRQSMQGRFVADRA